MIKSSMGNNWISDDVGGGASSQGNSDGRLSFRQLAAQSQRKPRQSISHGSMGVRHSVHEMAGSEASRKQLYQEASDYLTGVIVAVRAGEDFQIGPALEILKRVADIQTPFDALFLKAIHSDDSHNFVVNHSVNLSIYAMKMAERLGFSRSKQVEIGLLALFHDVGMALISDDIVYKKERLSEREFEQLKERPLLGYNILKKYEKEYPFLPEGTLQVYERIDGSGYPNGLIGEEITEYAQIVGLIDVYEALIHTRPQRQRLPHFFAVKEIIRTGKTKFQRRYLKALLNTFSIFPLLSYVRLNSKAVGQVIKTYPEQPMRPKVRVIFDSQNQRVLTERVINLPENPLLYITESISEEELSAISDQAESVPAKRQAETDTKDETHGRKGRDSKRQRGKRPSKRRWPFFRMGMAPLGITSVVFVITAAISYYGPLKLGFKENAKIVESANAQQHDGGDVDRLMQANRENVAWDGQHRNQEKINRDLLGRDSEKQDAPAIANENLTRSQTMDRNLVVKTVDPGMAMEHWEPAYPYSIKFASHKSKLDAEKAVSEFVKIGIPAYWVKVDLGDHGVWYRVFSGYFENYEAAKRYMSRNGIQGSLVKQTEYATLIGSFDSNLEAEAFLKKIDGNEFCPYLVKNNEKHNVLVGAFYTKKGATDQYSELAASGISGKIIQR